MRKDLLGIDDLSADEIYRILDTAEAMREIGERPIKKVPTLRGKTVVNLFYEPSTRTRTSFEIAEKRLSADTLNIAVQASSVLKGETLADTAMNIEAMAPDMIVMRHSSSGACHLLSRICKSRIINAGDGLHEHPTQALLDAFTIRQHKPQLEGLKVAIVGDLLHSRVLRSNVQLLTKLGAHVFVSGPPTLVPRGIEQLGVTVAGVDEAVQDADVVMMLHREDYYHRGDPNWADENPDKVGTAELILAKQRNGPTGTVDLVWDGSTTSFKSRAYAAMPEDMGRDHRPRSLAAPTRMRVAEEPSDDLPV